ncbi:MAG: FlgD immunoglobulin-like domain containing protein [candidate division WOR-3 bacterium]
MKKLWALSMITCILVLSLAAETLNAKKVENPGFVRRQNEPHYLNQTELIQRLTQARKNNDLAEVQKIQKMIQEMTNPKSLKIQSVPSKPPAHFRIIPSNKPDNKSSIRWGGDMGIGAMISHERAGHLTSTYDGAYLYAAYELWNGNTNPDMIRVRYSQSSYLDDWYNVTVDIDEAVNLQLPAICATTDNAYVAFNYEFNTSDHDIYGAAIPLGGSSATTFVIEATGNNVWRPYITSDVADFGSGYYLYVVASDITNGQLMFYVSYNYGTTWYSSAIGTISTSGPEFASISYAPGAYRLDVCYVGTDGNIWYTSSPDYGSSWSTPIPISGGSNLDNFPEVASKGNLVMVVYEYLYGGSDWDIRYSYSIDGGISWSTDNWLAGSLNWERFPSVSIDIGYGDAIYASYVNTDEGNMYVFRATLSNPTGWNAYPGVVNDGASPVSYDDRTLVAASYDEIPVPNYGVCAAWIYQYSSTDWDFYCDADWIGIEEQTTSLVAKPSDVVLKNSPNPFTGETKIQFVLPQAEKVSLKVYDTQGKLVKTIVDGHKETGIHIYNWDGKDDMGNIVPRGLYFCVLQTSAEVKEAKMVLTK